MASAHSEKAIIGPSGAHLNRLKRFALVNALLASQFVTATAQSGGGEQPRSGFAPVVTVSGDSVDRLRLNQLQGTAPAAGFLLRSTSHLMLGASARSFTLVLPDVYYSYNSALPSGENDGSLWAGKGSNFRAITGVEWSIGSLRVVLLPELSAYANSAFQYTPQFVAPLPATRNPYSSPWNVFPYSIDAPVRFGGKGATRLSPGQSSITISFPKTEFGFSTENEWWGPGIRTAIVMSDNAEGYPRLFLGMPKPLDTSAGSFDVRWMWGGLTESPWFDSDPTNNLRSISSIAGTWTPSFEPDLALGFARSVFAPSTGWGQAFSRAFDAFASTGRPNARAVTDTAFKPGRDQIFSLFGRWVFPDHGFETYAEWARDEMPRSFRDFLVAPNNGQGYTYGLQWVRDLGGGKFRLQAEHSFLEQSSTFRNRPQGSFYTSRSVIQGYTNRGKVIGAGMGQGSSGEWFAADYLKRAWQIGGFGAWTRFNNDAAYQLPGIPPQDFCPHDITLSPGLRLGAPTPLGKLSVKYARNFRFNAFFQDRRSCFGYGPSVDIWNSTLSFGITAGSW